jgi:hypothetical protein
MLFYLINVYIEQRKGRKNANYLELVMAKLTLGGTLKPNDLATFARSRLSTSKIFFKW